MAITKTVKRSSNSHSTREDGEDIWLARMERSKIFHPDGSVKTLNTASVLEPTIPRNGTMQLDFDAIDESMVCHDSPSFTISCGTVTLDFKASNVLLIFNQKLQIYQLPKGRKDIGEDFVSAAIRETYEETGYRVELLPLLVGTRATIPPHHMKGPAPAKKVEVATNVLNTEPLAMCTYPDPQTESSTPVHKMVFYYAARLEASEMSPESGTQKSHERMINAWVSPSKAVDLLRFKAERDVVKKAVADARNSGYDIHL